MSIVHFVIMISRPNFGIYINQPRQIEAFSVYSILIFIDDVNPDASKMRQQKQARCLSNSISRKIQSYLVKHLKKYSWHARNKIFDYTTAINNVINAHLHTAAPRRAAYTNRSIMLANTLYSYLGPLTSLELNQAAVHVGTFISQLMISIVNTTNYMISFRS